MTPGARLLAALAMVIGFASLRLPLWEVRLGAPQYPEGLGLRIHAHTVAGLTPNDLANINGLNHYIGMRPIVPDAIPELAVMPWVIGTLLGVGLAIVLIGGRRVLRAWLIVAAVLGVLGVWDFWRWEYRYGHDLDLERAIIIVPGMTYQPPLIGTKQLLNFTATAWPGMGAVALAVAAAGAAGLLLAGRRTRT